MRYIAALLLVLVTTGSAATQTAVEKPDPRLDQKVTLEVSHEKLEDVCKQLTDQTGVTIKAGSGERDWKVRERRVTIEAMDIELGTLMKEISKLLGFYLSRSGKEDEWAYLYWQDLKARTLESEMLSAEKEAAAQRARKMCESAISQATDALKLTPEEALKKKSEDPLLAYMGGTKSGRGWAQLLSSLGNFPTEKELLMRGQRAVISFDSSPPGMQEAAIDAASGGIVAGQARDGQGPALTDLVPYQFGILPVSQTDNYEAGVLGLNGLVVITGLKPGDPPASSDGPLGLGNPMGMFLIADPDARICDMVGRFLFEIDAGASTDEAGKKLNEELQSPEMLASLLQEDSPTETTPPTDPRMTREVEIDKEVVPAVAGVPGELSDTPENTGKTLALISKAIGAPVMLESFPRLLPPSLFIRPGKQPLYKVLIGLEKTGFTWELDDDALRVRPRDWALRRSYEIQEGYLAYYRDLLAKQGMLTLDDVGKIALDLTDGQIGNTLLADPDFMWMNLVFGDLTEGKNILRFYASLTAQQKSALRTEAGLPFSQLTTEQWDRVGSAISNALGGVYVQDGSVLLKPDLNAAETQGSVHHYDFQISVQVADETELRVLPNRITIYGKRGIELLKKQRDEMTAARKKAAEEKQKTEETK